MPQIRSSRPRDVQVWQNVGASDPIDVGNILINDGKVILIVDDILQGRKSLAKYGLEVLNGISGIGRERWNRGDGHELIGLVIRKAKGEGGEVRVIDACCGRSIQEVVDHCETTVPAVDCCDYLVLPRTRLTLGPSYV
jgi:hypothetical protein